MALTIPEGLRVKRAKSTERRLYDWTRDWLTREERTPGVHASELLDPRRAFWQRIDPQALTDREVTTFLVGRVLHAFVLSAVEGKPLDWKADEGSRTSPELGIEFSPDKVYNRIVREVKTSRAFYEPKSLADIESYLEQVLIYLAATDTTQAQIWVLYLNLKNEKKQTEPAFRVYTVEIDPADLAKVKKEIAVMRELLLAAVEKKDHTILPLCREWLCTRTRCPWYDKCQPEGRWKPERKRREKSETSGSPSASATTSARTAERPTTTSTTARTTRTSKTPTTSSTTRSTASE